MVILVVSIWQVNLAFASAVDRWRLDGGTGTKDCDNISSYDGTISGATWVSGKIGAALQFDGVNNYVEIPSLDLTGNLSAEAWVYVDDLTHKWGGIVSTGDTWTTRALTLGFTDINLEHDFKFAVWNSTGAMGQTYVSTSGYTNRWVHVMGTYDGSYVRLYLNGIEVAKTPLTGSIRSVSDKVYMGCWLSKHYFNGTIDEVKINNQAIPPTLFQNIHLAQSSQ
jgi:hypothetical protein